MNVEGKYMSFFLSSANYMYGNPVIHSQNEKKDK